MAERTLNVPAYVEHLAGALHDRLPGAHVSYEHVRGDRYRFAVVWDGFSELGHPERQRLVWDLADGLLSKPELLNVAMIITLSPAEVQN